MKEALVFSVEEFSTYDGPGIRTTVFLKGCPLRCGWCHNPEGQSPFPELLKAQSGCTGCGSCKRAEGIGQAVESCPNGLLRRSGTPYTPKALVKELEGSFPILEMAGGGVTFSGGEPLQHSEFLLACLELLRGRIHTAVQTSGFCREDVFEKILRAADYFLYDIKLVSDREHRRYTGVSNESILQNYKTLCRSGKPFVTRTPLIPTVTDSVENLTGIAKLLASEGVEHIELLPYNPAAGGKYGALGRSYAPGFDTELPVTPRTDIFESMGIRAAVL